MNPKLAACPELTQRIILLSSMAFCFYSVFSDEATGETTSHLTKPLKRQVIGYSHSTKLAKDASQVAGYVSLWFNRLFQGKLFL